MSTQNQSGQSPFAFAHRPDLGTLPQQAQVCEVDLHGGFALDRRGDFGHIYYGMPGCGLIRIDADLKRQELIQLPDGLTKMNFHSTSIGAFDGQWRLFLPADKNEQVAVVTLEGKLEYVLRRPEFEEYQAEDVPYKPTDTLLVGNQLYIADGYGSNYILSADVTTRQWMNIFGGKTEDENEHGKFMTAHGFNLVAATQQLAIADRPLARIQMHGLDGGFVSSHRLPTGAWPCGIDFLERDGRTYAVVGSLYDPVKDRPAPIYILDAATYEVLSTIRPKEELGIEAVQHLHNVVWQVYDDQVYLVCQSWNPGHYFVLELTQ